MRKKELIAKIEKLEKVVEFLCNYDKDTVLFGTNWLYNSLAKYLYKNEIKTANIDNNGYFTVIENKAEHILVRCDKVNVLGSYSIYYKIDKAKAIAQEIPKPAFVLEKELADKKASAKSGTKKGTEKKS